MIFIATYYLVNKCYTVVNSASCASLNNPDNGVVNCNLGDDGVSSYQDTCSFTCNTGYELTGSDTRTCQSDGSWSGSEIMCSRGKCVIIIATKCVMCYECSIE